MGAFWPGPKAQDSKQPTDLATQLAAWRESIEAAVKASEHGSAREGLELGIREAANASLDLMRRMRWNPDEGMTKMFVQEHGTPEKWAQALRPSLPNTTDKAYLEWWQTSQRRVLEETNSAVEAARKNSSERVKESIEALVMESFAACVIALPGVKKAWNEIVA